MKIRNQTFFIFLILGISASVLASLLIFYESKRIIIQQTFSNLDAIAQVKKTRLEKVIETNHETLTLIANSAFIRQQMSLLTKESSSKKNSSVILDSVLGAYKDTIQDYLRIYISDKNGIIVSSSDKSYIGKNIADKESFKKAITNKYYLDVSATQDKDSLIIIGSTLIYGSNRSVMGTLHVNMSTKELIAITHDYTGQGQTGETLIGKRHNGQILFLTPTRFNKSSSGANMSISDTAYYALYWALQEKDEIIPDVRDYRNKKVIASGKLIKETDWSLVTKVDKKEAYAAIYNLRNFLILFNIAFIVIAFTTSYYVGRYVAKPLEELMKSTNKIADGDLSSRIQKIPNNEIGHLAKSFNSMADILENKISELNKVGYVISHDLRAPLNNIIPLIQYIKEDNKDLHPESIDMLNMIESNALQMNELILEILETAKTQKKSKELISVYELVNTIISHLRPPPEISVYIQKDLPFVQFHKISITQVFQNLLENAIKYMDKKFGKIKVECVEENGYCKFSITDNGPGIREEDFNKIFEMFESRNTRTEIPSSGIGLGVAKKIIEDNGGKIWVESQIGLGSTFYFTIPKE